MLPCSSPAGMGAQAGVNPMQQAMALQQNPELMAQMLDNPVQPLWRVRGDPGGAHHSRSVPLNTLLI